MNYQQNCQTTSYSVRISSQEPVQTFCKPTPHVYKRLSVPHNWKLLIIPLESTLVGQTFPVLFKVFSVIISYFLLHQFRYKTRVYKQTNLDEKQLAKLHTKVI